MLSLQNMANAADRSVVLSHRVRTLRENMVLLNFNESNTWQDCAQNLCKLAILESVLCDAEVPHLGKDVALAEWWRLRYFLPTVLAPFMHSKMQMELGEARHEIRRAYQMAYKQVVVWFPWLEQNSVDLTA